MNHRSGEANSSLQACRSYLQHPLGASSMPGGLPATPPHPSKREWQARLVLSPPWALERWPGLVIFQSRKGC